MDRFIAWVRGEIRPRITAYFLVIAFCCGAVNMISSFLNPGRRTTERRSLGSTEAFPAGMGQPVSGPQRQEPVIDSTNAGFGAADRRSASEGLATTSCIHRFWSVIPGDVVGKKALVPLVVRPFGSG